ncbi:MAG: GspE/PulE family protein [Pirellulales bacterium]|nr:GspE/PulE family protein [Pirellulales bacterium]
MSSAMGDFTELLITQGIISRDQVREADQMRRGSDMTLADALIRLGYATGAEVMRAVAQAQGLDFVDLRATEIPQDIVELVPESVARENSIMPVSEASGGIKILMSDPNDVETLDKLRFILDRRIDVAVAPRENIQEAINHYYGQTDAESADSMLQEFTDTAIDFTETMTESADEETGEAVDESSAPIVRLVHLIISEAVQLRASDIHIEPFEDRVRVRYRIDGVLVERDSCPRRLLGALISRVKILAKIDIAERRRPQDGRIKATVADKELDFRVSVLPTNHGQSVVMRILDKDSIRVGLRQLGMSEDDFKVFRSLIRRPNGIILITGPTGSGKTTTLYAALNELNRPDRKIITAEDPVEYYLPGVNQVEVRHSIGLDFARIIRSMLRQAPNIILVGEMRDHETAEMGIQASLTGHLVFSTLHTNDAPGAITRMIDMKVPAYLVASSIIGVMAQRLVRVICQRCKQPHKPTEAALKAAGIDPEQAKTASFAKGRGCGHCNKTGYRGRMGIFELMPMTSKIREMAFAGKSSQLIRDQAVSSGMKTLYEDGVQKAMAGTTTLEEIFRVAKQTPTE